MEASEGKQTRVTNNVIQEQLIKLSVGFDRIGKDIQEIKETLIANGKRMTEMEKNEAGQRPLIERRLDVLEKRTDKHDEQIQELAKLSQSLASSVKVLNWITGILSGGVLTWIVTQILSLIAK